MKQNQTTVLCVVLILAGFGLACKMLGKSEGNSNQANSSNISKVSVSPTVAKAECSTRTFSVGELKGNELEKYEGCTLSVQGKLWQVTNEVVTLIDIADRTDYNGSFFIGGNFSGGTYSEIALKISKIKIDQQFDRLPIATFTGTINKVEGNVGLRNAVLTNVQR